MDKDEEVIVYHRLPLSTMYLRILEKLARDLKSNSEKNDWGQTLPFILTAAASLECILNDEIIEHCSNRYGLIGYLPYADGFISMPLGAKLAFIFPFISDNIFGLRESSQLTNQLNRLISLRNFLMHNKSFTEESIAKIIPNKQGKRVARVPHGKGIRNLASSLSTKNCISVYENIILLKQLLSKADQWNANETLFRFPARKQKSVS